MQDDRLQFVKLYRIPGEGVVAEFRDKTSTFLFDIRGLNFRIVKRRSGGFDTSEEEKVLGILRNMDPS